MVAGMIYRIPDYPKRRSGFATSGTTHRQAIADREEVAALLERMPDATRHDVMMECNMGRHQAERLLREARG
jgi:hypothetical protein